MERMKCANLQRSLEEKGGVGVINIRYYCKQKKKRKEVKFYEIIGELRDNLERGWVKRKIIC